jgi:hypothetical protein
MKPYYTTAPITFQAHAKDIFPPQRKGATIFFLSIYAKFDHYRIMVGGVLTVDQSIVGFVGKNFYFTGNKDKVYRMTGI